MDESRLKEEVERKLFQEFKVRICTKRDENGQVRHSIIGKAYEISV